MPTTGREAQQIYDPKTGQLIWAGGFQEGQEWGELFGFVAEGIIRTQKDLESYNKFDEAAKQAYQNGGAGRGVASQKLITQYDLNAGRAANNPLYVTTQLGDVMWKDIDKNDTIDYRDRVSLGRTLPRWTGGFNTTVSPGKVSACLPALILHSGIFSRTLCKCGHLTSAQGEFNATDIVKDTWTPENPNAKYPRYVWADQFNTKNFDRPSSMFFVNSSYLAFREVSLSYSLPFELLKKAKISGLRLTVTGQNLGYITNRLAQFTGAYRSAKQRLYYSDTIGFRC